MDNFNGMSVRRKVFLHEHCSGCGQKIHRLLLGNKCSCDDNGGEVIQTQVVEICDCVNLRAATSIANWPCTMLEELFDSWNASQLSRADFDHRLETVLKNAGAHWQSEAS